MGASGYHLPAANTGRVYIFHSAGAGGISSTGAASATTIFTGEATGNFFGVSVALGDVNGDGYADAIVGAYGYDPSPNTLPNTGRVYIFYTAGAGGIASTLAASATTKLTGETTGDYFGLSVALGDVNGDDRADAIVGAYKHNTNTGRVYIFYTAGAGGIVSTLAASATTRLTGEITSNQFGSSVALGDANGDGYADAIVGAVGYDPGSAANTGRVYIFYSAGAGGIASMLAASATTKVIGETMGDYFGNSVALGDVNGDGYADAIVGAYGYDPGSATDTGRVYSFHSAGATGMATTGAASATAILTGEAENNQFGYSVK